MASIAAILAEPSTPSSTRRIRSRSLLWPWCQVDVEPVQMLNGTAEVAQQVFLPWLAHHEPVSPDGT